MKLWGYLDTTKQIEFISYRAEYHDQVLEVIRNAFFNQESVSVASEIDKNVDAQRDLEGLCEDVLKKSCVSIIARAVDNDKVVGVALNVIQVKQKQTELNFKSTYIVFLQVKTPSSDAPSYFENFRDGCCATENAKCLMNYMIEADSKVDIFEHFKVESLLEIMFLAVLPEHGKRGIALELCKHSVELARELSEGCDVKEYLEEGTPRPQLVSALWTGRYSQKIGHKLGFEVIFQESFSKFSFNGKTFCERIGDPDLVYHVAAKRLKI
jgi:ribosomal protein S18 acetylase RimI-like enzyme